MARTMAVAAVAIATVAGLHAAQTVPSVVDLKGKLYRAVFSPGAGMLTADDLRNIPEPLRQRLSTFLDRRAAFKSAYKSSPDEFEKVRADAKRRELERSIVALIEAPGVERAAVDFVAAAPIAYEWEGKHDGPLAEAGFAEAALARTPSSPLAPWLAVFIAHRQRVAFEASGHEKNDAAMAAAARKYRDYLARARASSDPIFAALADDLDRQPWVYIKGSPHPRDAR